MLIPYSTDAPIYHFPWMTIVLIVVNGIAFAITAMGLNSEGWILTYGQGLHPLEWVAYNFLHFGPFHLIGNMFFLWAFGIVVEGKLGCWKFLLAYLSIGILGGVLIQTAMLGHVSDDLASIPVRSPATGWLWSGNVLYAQDEDFDDEMRVNAVNDRDANAVGGPIPVGGLNEFDNNDPNEAIEGRDVPIHFYQSGAGGASLVIYGLMAIVLVWAPRNEIYCAWIGLRTGTFEVEYLYFCGFYIVVEVLSAVFSVRGFEVTSEIGHATGALLGFGLGTLFVKLDWVDCEKWDLYSVISGKNYSNRHDNDWQNDHLVRTSRKGKEKGEFDESSLDSSIPTRKKKKKAKPKPKLVELDSFDDPFETSDAELEASEPPKVTSRPKTQQRPPAQPSPLPPLPPPIPKTEQGRLPVASSVQAQPTDRIHQRIHSGELANALRDLQLLRTRNPTYELAEPELHLLSDGLFKEKRASEAAPLLEEYIRRFGDHADHQRVKLSVLYIRFLRKPTAALKLLVTVKTKLLPDDYRQIHQKAAREAQKMIADGVDDVGDS